MSGGGFVGGESLHRLYEPRNELKILSLNARSVLPKMESLQLLAQAEDLDVICVVETWLSAEILDAEISLCGYQCFRRDRNRHGGGVVVYVRDCIVAATMHCGQHRTGTPYADPLSEQQKKHNCHLLSPSWLIY